MIKFCSLWEYYDACGDVRIDSDGDLDIEIKHITNDSREVQPGSLFVAINGTTADGRMYIPQAMDNGAAAVVYMQEERIEFPIPSIRVRNDYAALGKIAAFHYGYPASGMTTIGVTGTNGKTTTSFLLRSIFNSTNIKTGLIGSVCYDVGDQIIQSCMTTPAPLQLQNLLYQMKEAGVQLVIMEVSSHALIQKRLGNLCFDVGIFTNLTADHLDFHATMEDYYNAKKLLFLQHLKPGATAIINTNDTYGQRLKDELLSEEIDTDVFFENPKYPEPATKENRFKTQKIATYSLDVSSHCHPAECNFSLNGTELSLKLVQGEVHLNHSLIGMHNVYNVMAAVSAAKSLGILFSDIIQGVELCNGVNGRLQRIPDDESDVTVFIDYAHTENALDNVLQALKPHCQSHLNLVFGCGGDRDKNKRSKMGQVASRHTSHIIITSDNPRSEDPESIIDDIREGIPSNHPYTVLIDRRKAIFTAITDAAPGDTVLIAGKGHEQFQEIKNKRSRFDDYLVCQEALKMRIAAIHQPILMGT